MCITGTCSKLKIAFKSCKDVKCWIVWREKQSTILMTSHSQIIWCTDAYQVFVCVNIVQGADCWQTQGDFGKKSRYLVLLLHLASWALISITSWCINTVKIHILGQLDTVGPVVSWFEQTLLLPLLLNVFKEERVDTLTDGWTDRRYQTYYIPAFAVDKATLSIFYGWRIPTWIFFPRRRRKHVRCFKQKLYRKAKKKLPIFLTSRRKKKNKSKFWFFFIVGHKFSA